MAWIRRGVGTSCVHARRPSRTIRRTHSGSSISRCVASLTGFTATRTHPRSPVHRSEPELPLSLSKVTRPCPTPPTLTYLWYTDQKVSPSSASHVSDTQTPSSSAPDTSVAPNAPKNGTPSRSSGTSHHRLFRASSHRSGRLVTGAVAHFSSHIEIEVRVPPFPNLFFLSHSHPPPHRSPSS